MLIGRYHSSILKGRLVKRAHVESGNAFQIRVGEGHVRARADHQIGVARRRPARDPPAVPIVLYEPFDHLRGHRRRQQGVRWPGRAVRVPEAVVHVDFSFSHRCARFRFRRGSARFQGELAGVRVNRLLDRAHVLKGRVRVKEQPVQIRVQGHELVFRRTLYLDDAQLVFPGLLCPLHHGFERVVRGDLHLEVPLRLLHTDQGRRDAHGDHRAFRHVKLEVGPDIGPPFAAEPAAFDDRAIERGVDEHACSSRRKPAAVIGVRGKELLSG